MEFMKLFILCDSDDCNEVAKRQFMSQDQFGTEYRLHLCQECTNKPNIQSKKKRFIYEVERKKDA